MLHCDMLIAISYIIIYIHILYYIHLYVIENNCRFSLHVPISIVNCNIAPEENYSYYDD